jgi:hypothetical protein
MTSRQIRISYYQSAGTKDRFLLRLQSGFCTRIILNPTLEKMVSAL